MRKQKRIVNIGSVKIGGDNPVAIQSMCNTDTRDVKATVNQIHELENAGCEIIRVAVPDMVAAKAVADIKKQIHIPLVVDIHFDYRLALECMKNGADKVRINPGNIGDRDRVKQVVEMAKEREIPIRIGVNGGSLERELLQKYGGVTAVLWDTLQFLTNLILIMWLCQLRFQTFRKCFAHTENSMKYRIFRCISV